jgi:hypothetical protein
VTNEGGTPWKEVGQLKAQIDSLQKQLAAGNKKGIVRSRGKKKKNK